MSSHDGTIQNPIDYDIFELQVIADRQNSDDRDGCEEEESKLPTSFNCALNFNNEYEEINTQDDGVNPWTRDLVEQSLPEVFGTVQVPTGENVAWWKTVSLCTENRLPVRNII